MLLLLSPLPLFPQNMKNGPINDAPTSPMIPQHCRRASRNAPLATPPPEPSCPGSPSSAASSAFRAPTSPGHSAATGWDAVLSTSPFPWRTRSPPQKAPKHFFRRFVTLRAEGWVYIAGSTPPPRREWYLHPSGCHPCPTEVVTCQPPRKWYLVREGWWPTRRPVVRRPVSTQVPGLEGGPVPYLQRGLLPPRPPQQRAGALLPPPPPPRSWSPRPRGSGGATFGLSTPPQDENSQTGHMLGCFGCARKLPGLLQSTTPKTTLGGHSGPSRKKISCCFRPSPLGGGRRPSAPQPQHSDFFDANNEEGKAVRPRAPEAGRGGGGPFTPPHHSDDRTPNCSSK